MSIHEIPGGQVELRDRPTVGGRELLQEEMFALTSHIQRQIERVRREEGRDLLTRDGKPLALDKMADLNEIPSELMDREFVKASHALQRAAVVAFVKAWTLPFPPPTIATVGDLDPELYDALCALVNPRVQRALLGENFGPDALVDPKAQPGGSNASSASGSATPSTTSTVTSSLLNSTENTDTGASSDLPATSTWTSQPTL